MRRVVFREHTFTAFLPLFVHCFLDSIESFVYSYVHFSEHEYKSQCPDPEDPELKRRLRQKFNRMGSLTRVLRQLFAWGTRSRESESFHETTLSSWPPAKDCTRHPLSPSRSGNRPKSRIALSLSSRLAFVA